MKREKIKISGDGLGYEAFVGRGLLQEVGELARQRLEGKRCAVIADENSARLFAERVCRSLRVADFHHTLIVIPAGESSKSLTQVESICAQMVGAGLDRSSFVLGLGGGVVSDLSGFVAAVFHRGLPHLQIPTTLLAMVDSAIGGKTGVNLAVGKNLLGAIHQPVLIVADTDALDSLPARELRQGYAEIIKHAVIRDAAMLTELGELDQVELVRRNIAIKAQIVAADAREISGERALLNFGHTVGHAIERATDFRLSHGDCVSLGTVAACDISSKRAGLSRHERDEVVAALEKFELPTHLPSDISRERILKAVKRDKKFVNGRVRFVLTPRLGSAHLAGNVTLEDIKEAISQL